LGIPSAAAQGTAREAGKMKGRLGGLGSAAALMAVCVLAATTACNQSKSNDAPASAPAGASEVTHTPAATSDPVGAPVDVPNAPKINAARAIQYTKEVTAFGARPIGSANHKKLEDYIVAHLNGDQVEDDTFTAETVEGKFPV